MPYIDKEKQNRYQREWMASRRRKWLEENGPCIDCSSWHKLEVDHVNPEEKVSHNVWSWSEKRRLEELDKCVVRCTKCHKKKTAKQREERMKHGTDSMYCRKGCRCKMCVIAHNKINRDWKIRTGYKYRGVAVR